MVPEKHEDLLAGALQLTADMAEESRAEMLLHKGLSLCTGVLDCDQCLLIEESPEGTRRVLSGTEETKGEQRYSATALRLVAERNEPLLISDTLGDKELSARESIARHEIRSVLCAALDTGGEDRPQHRLYLYLDSSTDRHAFSQNDLEHFRLLCRLIGALVRKSELLASREAALEELRGRMEERRFEDLVFAGESFGKCIDLVKQGAAVDVPLLLSGETGTGKERLAHIAHELSPRKEAPFIAVNCGAIPPTLIESHLFGHEKGAFTGALATRKGCFEEANRGTLFLDEIGELPQEAQAHFLRALQQGEITRVGSSKPIRVDVRIVAATNVDLEQAVEEKRFRKDLFYRLNVLPIRVPPVRERGEDAVLLARFFLRKHGESLGQPNLTLGREAEKAILVHDWPGNVREIENRIQRAVITSSGGTIGTGDLGLDKAAQPQNTSLREAREALDREMIGNALARSPGNVTKAAQILGIDRKSLRILLEKYGIEQR